MAKKKTEEVEETVAAAAEETAAAEEAAVQADAAETAEVAVEAPAAEKKPAKKAAAKKAKAEPKAEDTAVESDGNKGKRAEKIGVVASDKMEKTVTVRVDRLVKHPTYRKYVRRRKKFMAHDELGAKPGDKVRIVETRPMSARKRWRVVEILQKAER